MASNTSGLDRAVRKGQLVEVVWQDITAYSDWTPLPEVKLPTFKTIGYLVEKNKERVILAHTKDEKGDWFGFDLFPRGCVLSMSKIWGKNGGNNLAVFARTPKKRR